MRAVGATGEMPILFTLDLEGNFKSVNAAGEQVLGYSAAEMRLMNITDLVGPDFSVYLHSEIANAADADLGNVYQIEIHTKDGQSLPLEISTRLVTRHGSPFELEGIAFPLVNTIGGRPRCLDEQFWIGPGLNDPKTLTFMPTR